MNVKQVEKEGIFRRMMSDALVSSCYPVSASRDVTLLGAVDG